MQDIAIVEYKKVDYPEQYIKVLSLVSHFGDGSKMPPYHAKKFFDR